MRKEEPASLIAVRDDELPVPALDDDLRSLILLSKDGYWEQDASFRFTHLEGRLSEEPDSLLTPASLGQTPWDLGMAIGNDGNWQGWREALAAGQALRHVLFSVQGQAGEPRYLSVTTQAVQRAGQIAGYRSLATDITRKHLDEQDMVRFRAAMDASESMLFMVDRQTMKYLYVNDTALQLGGFSRSEMMQMSPAGPLAISQEELEASYDQLIASESRTSTVRMRASTKDGTLTIIEMHRRALLMNDRWVIITTAHDVSQQVLAEKSRDRLQQMFAALSATNEAIMKVRTPEKLYQRVCDAAVDGGQFLAAAVLLPDGEDHLKVAAWTSSIQASDLPDPAGLAVSVSVDAPEGSGLAGTASRSLKTCISHDYLNDARTAHWHDQARRAGIRSAAAVPLVRGSQSIGVLLLHSDDRRKFDEEVVALLQRLAENIVFGLNNFQHERERKRNEKRVQYLATHDSLTRLPNRVMFNELLHQLIDTSQRYHGKFALIFIDLDRFKLVNESLGREAGDTVLRTVSQRLARTLRASDVIARLGGDEFAVLVHEVSQRKQISEIARKLLSAAIEPISIGGRDYRVTASMGIARYPVSGKDAKVLLRSANQAMHMAKEAGKNNFQFFSRGRARPTQEHLTLETHLRGALQREELSLCYQARVSLRTGRITGAEVLLRWKNPELGVVTPTSFIPIAEETGLIVPIGRWVMKTACAQSLQWQVLGLPPIVLSINLSPRQLLDPHLVEDISQLLTRSGMSPGLLEVEVSETLLMTNPERATEVLTELRELGVRVAIDDFGTGYSTMAQLKNFPVNTLKVDRSFIRGLPDDAEDRTLTETTIAMGRSLGMTVIAEGVETREQQDYLRKHHCDEMQGFYFSKPLRAEAFTRLLSRQADGLQQQRQGT